MSKKIVIIDYSLGNIFSVKQAFSYFGTDTLLSNQPADIASADAIVLPGVGAFGEAMKYLKANNLDIAIKDMVNKGKPFLGICLGMQLLFNKSEEFGASEGLGLINGEIKKFKQREEGQKLLVPQVGWNNIKPIENANWQGTILQQLPENSFMYFVHSYYAVPIEAKDILSLTNYGGISYCSAVMKKNIVATQFHPEKSGQAGLSIYENWLNKI